MKQLTCEVCGAHNLLKQGEFFVCQSCGCQYTDVSKLLIEVDNSKETNNLRILAQRARATSNVADAQKYYNELVLKDPKDWEATFFSVYFSAANCKIYQISTAADNIKGALVSTFLLISKYVPNSEQNAVYDSICKYTISISDAFYDTAKSHFDEFSTVDGSSNELVSRVFSIKDMLDTLGVCLRNAKQNQLAFDAYYQMLSLDSKFSTLPSNPHLVNDGGRSIIKILGQLNPAISKYESTYIANRGDVNKIEQDIADVPKNYSAHGKADKATYAGCGIMLSLLISGFFALQGSEFFIVLTIISVVLLFVYLIYNEYITKSKKYVEENNDIKIEREKLSEKLKEYENQLKAIDNFSSKYPLVKTYIEKFNK